MPTPSHADSSQQPDTQPYLTYKLEVIKKLAVTTADPLYRDASGLRIKEVRLLRLIHDYPSITSSALKIKLALDKILLSKHLAALEQRGLVEKMPDKTDNRIQQLRLTVAGEQVWQTCESIGRGLEADFFAEMNEQEWQQLHHLLDKALQSLLHWQTCKKFTP